MSSTRDDDLIFAVNEVKDAVDKARYTTSDTWDATRRLDDAICGPMGVIPHISAAIAVLNKIVTLLGALLFVAVFHLVKLLYPLCC